MNGQYWSILKEIQSANNMLFIPIFMGKNSSLDSIEENYLLFELSTNKALIFASIDLGELIWSFPISSYNDYFISIIGDSTSNTLSNPILFFYKIKSI